VVVKGATALLLVAALMGSGGRIAHAQSTPAAASQLADSTSKWPAKWRQRFDARVKWLEQYEKMGADDARKQAEADVRVSFQAEAFAVSQPLPDDVSKWPDSWRQRFETEANYLQTDEGKDLLGRSRKLTKAQAEVLAEADMRAAHAKALAADYARAYENNNLPASLKKWPDNWKEAYEERAAIMYEGNMVNGKPTISKADAEKLAQENVRSAYRDEVAREAALGTTKIEPKRISTGSLTGNWDLLVKSGNKTEKAKLDFDGINGSMDFGGQPMKFAREGTSVKGAATNGSIVGRLNGDDLLTTKVNLEVESMTGMSGTFEITNAKGKVVSSGTVTASRKPPSGPKSYALIRRPAEELAESDPGPTQPVMDWIAQYPGQPLYRGGIAWDKWGAKFSRGRAGTGEAKVMIICSDPGPDETIFGRTLVGDAGKRVQGFLQRVLGPDAKNYVLVNAHQFAIRPGSAFDMGPVILHDPTLTKWRNEYFDRVIGPEGERNLKAIVVMGEQAKAAVALWTDHPDVPVIEANHPSNHDGPGTVAKFAAAVKQLRKIVTPDSDAPLPANYGTGDWQPEYKASIPRRDLPAGTSEFVGRTEIANLVNRPPGDQLFGNKALVTAPDIAWIDPLNELLNTDSGLLSPEERALIAARSRVATTATDEVGLNPAELTARRGMSRSSTTVGSTLVKERVEGAKDGEKDKARER
jgi:hypothetical protein